MLTALEGFMDYSQLLSDVREYINHGGRHDRILVLIEGKHNILATGIGRHDNGLAFEFNSRVILDFYKRKAFASFCSNHNLAPLEKWKTSECITPRAELPSNEYEVISILKEYFKSIHKLDDGYDIQIHKRTWQ